eukprot:GHVO01015930.1.p2 GENE.GHVO01015930.1~~GHVO01015930.1.p2  ORF type:complete len:114 (-),score=5.49 GHVO01015930.1:741-1082(-)
MTLQYPVDTITSRTPTQSQTGLQVDCLSLLRLDSAILGSGRINALASASLRSSMSHRMTGGPTCGCDQANGMTSLNLTTSATTSPATGYTRLGSDEAVDTAICVTTEHTLLSG